MAITALLSPASLLLLLSPVRCLGVRTGHPPQPQEKPCLKHSGTCNSGVKQQEDFPCREVCGHTRHPGTFLPITSQLNYQKEAPNQHRNTRRHWRIALLGTGISWGLVCSKLEDLSEDDSKSGKGPVLSDGQHRIAPGTSPKVQ